MANEKNLIPQAHKLSVEEASKGGRNSVEARRAKKNLREAMQILMEADLTDKSGKTMTGTEAMAARAFQAALKGDWKAWELVRDTAGQKPVEKTDINVSGVNITESAQRLMEVFKGIKEDGT